MLFDSVVLYVEDIAASGDFYAELFGTKPLDLSPTFKSFDLDSGLKFELKERTSSLPPASVTGGGAELCMTVQDPAALDDLFGRWKEQGVAIAQEPTMLVFGLTFVAQDPDGHRIRVTAQKS